MASRPRGRRASSRRRIAAVLVLAALLVFAVIQARRNGSGAVRTGSAAAHGATIERYSVRSRFTRRTLPQVGAVPRGAGRRPLLVFLHGRGSDGEESNVNGTFFEALDALGARAPIVVFPNGDESSYWHRRASGDWARYVLDEVIPQAVRRLGADPRRVAIGGVSMGGYGAYHVARLRPRRFCAVGGHAAALWRSARESAEGAYDDAGDYARNDVLGLARARGRAPWAGARLWLDIGDRDPFRAGAQAFATALGIPLRVGPGEHDGHYVLANYPRYLRFYAAALAAC